MADSDLNACGCCAGLDAETPRRIDNSPGLDAVKYRVGVHALFKESLLARLSSAGFPALAPLTTREDSDFTIALCDALATTLDVLSFYQERIANENYLRTAIERRSIQELARLIGYELAPGVAASTWLAFTLQETPGTKVPAVEPVTLPVGVRVQSVPGQDEQAQTFETVEAVEARVEWNAIPVQTTNAWHPAYGDKSLWLAGVGTGLQPGDVILIVGQERIDAEGSERWDIRVVTSLEEDKVRERTRIAWGNGLGHASPHILPADAGAKVYVFRQRAALFGHNAPDPRLMGNEGGSQLTAHLASDAADGTGRVWNNYAISGSDIDLEVQVGLAVEQDTHQLAHHEGTVVILVRSAFFPLQHLLVICGRHRSFIRIQARGQAGYGSLFATGGRYGLGFFLCGCIQADYGTKAHDSQNRTECFQDFPLCD